MPSLNGLNNNNIDKVNEDLKNIILQRLKETENERKALFTTSDGKERSAEDLNEVERSRAVKLFEFIFGMLANRPEVKLYKQVHPEANDLDFIYINDQNLTQIINNDEAIQVAIKEGKVKPVVKPGNIMDEVIFPTKALEKVTKTSEDSLGFSVLKANDLTEDVVVEGIKKIGGKITEKLKEEIKSEDAEELNEGDESLDKEDRISEIGDVSGENDLLNETAHTVPSIDVIKEHIEFKDKSDVDVTSKVITENDALTLKIYEADNAVNKELKDIQAVINKEKPGSEKYMDAERGWKEVIDARLAKLADSYRMKEITQYYFTTRAEQLNALKNDIHAKIPKTPGVQSDKNPESMDQYDQLLHERVEGDLWKDNEHLTDLPTFIRWKLEQDDSIELDEFTKDQWELLYENECRREAEKKNMPLPEGVQVPVFETNEEREQRLSEELNKNNSQMILDSLVNDPEVSPDVKKLKPNNPQVTIGNDYMLFNARRLLKNELNNLIPELAEEELKEKDGKETPGSEMFRNTLCRMTANVIGHKVIQDNNDRVPGGLFYFTFNERMGKEPAFRKVIKPLLKEICEEYRQEKEKNPEVRVSDLPKAQRFLEMADDNSIFSAFGLQMKLDKKAKEQPAAGKGNNKGNAKENQNAENGAVKHAKEMLKQQPKPKGPAM